MPLSLHRKNTAKGSSVPMIIVALLIGVMVGFSSGWEISALQFRRSAAPPAPPAGPAAAVTPSPQDPAEVPTAVPANAVVYRGVVDAVVKGGLRVTVLEGVTGEPQVMLVAADYVALRPVQPAVQASGADTSKGLPPPPKPPAEPYAEEPMSLSDFKTGDVVEFSTAAILKDGATVSTAKAVWIMNLSQQNQQGGPVGDGTAAPLVPKK
ncbi:MAG TPA: hypothetical protein VL426_00595 [Candidatus Binatia bacterium]|nr:hypothetical protein [Candidatus Binatia bacterium]